MKISHRLLSGIVGACALWMAAPVSAQNYPTRPVTFVIPYPPGGAADIVGRLLGDKLSQKWKQPVIVTNRPGAGGVVGMTSVAQTAPDGYTFGLTTASVTLTLLQLEKKPIDLFKDFEAVGLVLTAPMLLAAHKSFPANTIQEWIEVVKAAPQPYFYGGTGQGGLGNMAGELIRIHTGAKLSYVPFQGSGPGIAALIANHVPMLLNDVGSLRSQLNAGTIKPILIASPKPSPLLPGVATIADLGIKDVDIKASHGILAPKGTPLAITREISEQVRVALNMPDVKARFESLGFEAQGSTPEAFVEFLKAEEAQFRTGLRVSGLGAAK